MPAVDFARELGHAARFDAEAGMHRRRRGEGSVGLGDAPRLVLDVVDEVDDGPDVAALQHRVVGEEVDDGSPEFGMFAAADVLVVRHIVTEHLAGFRVDRPDLGVTQLDQRRYPGGARRHEKVRRPFGQPEGEVLGGADVLPGADVEVPSLLDLGLARIGLEPGGVQTGRHRVLGQQVCGQLHELLVRPSESRPPCLDGTNPPVVAHGQSGQPGDDEVALCIPADSVAAPADQQVAVVFDVEQQAQQCLVGTLDVSHLGEEVADACHHIRELLPIELPGTDAADVVGASRVVRRVRFRVRGPPQAFQELDLGHPITGALAQRHRQTVASAPELVGRHRHQPEGGDVPLEILAGGGGG